MEDNNLNRMKYESLSKEPLIAEANKSQGLKHAFFLLGGGLSILIWNSVMTLN